MKGTKDLKEANKVSGWTTGRVVIASISAVIVVLILSAIAVFYGVNATVQTFIKNNPELLSVIGLMDSSTSGNQEMAQALLLAKYAKGSFDGTGQIDGSFKGRFTTVWQRSLEKVNLSCVDGYEYQIATMPQGRVGVFAANALISERRFNDKGCQDIGQFTKPGTFENGMTVVYNENYIVYRCPLNNCRMREVTREFAGDFIPESIDIRKVQAGVNSEIGK
ncbi:MAG: hypothetical protein HY376_03120 [Candidatus Blackburnbacteria bacterium]|nr:hypothetical protein [Candidatus Blackburnbacteria bacterium]